MSPRLTFPACEVSRWIGWPGVGFVVLLRSSSQPCDFHWSSFPGFFSCSLEDSLNGDLVWLLLCTLWGRQWVLSAASLWAVDGGEDTENRGRAVCIVAKARTVPDCMTFFSTHGANLPCRWGKIRQEEVPREDNEVSFSPCCVSGSGSVVKMSWSHLPTPSWAYAVHDWLWERERILYPLIYAPNAQTARVGPGWIQALDLSPALWCG